MGVAGSGPGAQFGLSNKTVDMTYDTSSHSVTRVSEASMIVQFGPGVFGHDTIRQRNLKLGVRIRRAHISAQLAVTTGSVTSPTQPPPPAGQYLPQTEDPLVTQELVALFGVDSCRFLFWSRPTERWIGFTIAGNTLPIAVSPAANDRLFFRIVLGRLDTSHVKDCELVPVIAGFGNAPLQQHYALGLSVYSRGVAAGAPTFDAQVLGNA
jgi:hypothetical protein